MNDQWLQVLTSLFGTFGIVWWFRKETRDDWKMHYEEMKDFHRQLLRLEKKQNRRK